MTFGELLKQARINKGLTQRQLAELIGAKHNSISNWENNQNKPDPDMIEYLCGALEVPANYFFPSSTLDSDTVTFRELQHIKKYRALDEHGKELVDTILDKEYSRMKQPDKDDNEEEDQEWRKYLGTPIAARGGMIYADEEFAKATYRIEQYNRERKKLKEQKKED